MAQKIDLETQAFRTAPSPGREPPARDVEPSAKRDADPSAKRDADPSAKRDATAPRDADPSGPDEAPTVPPRIERTLQLAGVGPRPSKNGKASTPNDLAPTIDAANAAFTSSPTSSERLAQLAAHLPRVPRDTYEVGTEVAKGGIGRVVRARDQRLDRPVALKELLVWNEGQEQRFIHEALLTARLQHPAIVPIYEAGRWPDGEPFYAMKLVSGRSLADLIGQRKRLEDRLSLLPHVLTVAQAIAYAHTQRILHRDLKPANVLVGEFGETVVIDWGLAKGLLDKDTGPSGEKPTISGEGLTIEGAVVGTPAYMPPEQAAGSPVDERADIYAIGAMLYHLIAAVPPYHDTPWEKLLAAIAEGPPTRIDRHVPAISDELRAIVQKAMARDPARRYATAKELADDLERLQTGQIVAAHTYSATHLLRRFWRKNRPVLSITLAAIAALGLVIAYAFVRTDAERRYALARKRDAEAAEQTALAARKAAEEAGKQATSRADELTLLQAQGALGRDPNQALAWLKTLSPGFEGASEMRRIAADAQARGLSRAFRGHTAHVNSILVLEGGARFVTASDDKTLRVWITATGESRVLTGHADEVWVAGASPDGAHLASVSKDATARIWDLASGKEIAKTTLPGPARQVMYRKDGSIVGGGGVGSGSPWIWPAGAEKVHPFADPGDEIVCSAISRDGEKVLYQRKDGTVMIADAGAAPVAFEKAPPEPGHWEIAGEGRTAVWVPDKAHEDAEYVVVDTLLHTRRKVKVPGVTARPLLTKRGDFAVFAASNHVHRYDVATGTLTRPFEGHGAPVYWGVLSADGQTLATGGYDKTVRTWSFSTGEKRTFAGLEGVVSNLVFWPDQTKIIACSSAGDVRLFDPGRDGAVLTDHHALSYGLAVSADGRVASVDVAGHLRITDLEGKPIAEHALGPAPNMRLRISQDGRRFAGSPWVEPRSSPTRPAQQAWLATGTFDATKPLQVTLPAFAGEMVFDPKGRDLFAGLEDGTVQKVDPSGALTEVDRVEGMARRLAISPDGAWLAVGATGGGVRLTEIATGEHRELGSHKDGVSALAFAPTGGLLASGSEDHTIRIWRLDDGSSRSIDASGAGVLRLAFSPDAKTLFGLNSLDALVHRWSVETGEAMAPLVGHTGPARGLVFSGDGRKLLTFSDDHTARLFDLATGSSRALPGQGKDLNAAAFGPGGHVVVTLSSDGSVRAWPDNLPETVPELRAWIDAATPDKLKER